MVAANFSDTQDTTRPASTTFQLTTTMRYSLSLTLLLLSAWKSDAWLAPRVAVRAATTTLFATKQRLCRARDLMKDLVEEQACYVTNSGAQAFVDACAANVVIEDRFFPQPFLGKTVRTTINASIAHRFSSLSFLCLIQYRKQRLIFESALRSAREKAPFASTKSVTATWPVDLPGHGPAATKKVCGEQLLSN